MDCSPTVAAEGRSNDPGVAKARGGRACAAGTSIQAMTRFLLTWLAFATFPLGAPRSGSGAELQAGGESSRPVPQLEVSSRDVLARIESRSVDLRPTHTPPLASVGAARLHLRPVQAERLAQRPIRIGPLFRSFLLPEARAPPA